MAARKPVFDAKALGEAAKAEIEQLDKEIAQASKTLSEKSRLRQSIVDELRGTAGMLGRNGFKAEAQIYLEILNGLSASSGKANDTQSGAIREWARKNGHAVGEKGRISQDILDAFEKAHSGKAE